MTPGRSGRRLLFFRKKRARAAHLDVGVRGERDAARFLRKLGCRTLARNLRTPGGEADLVCLDRKTGAVVLVEVKARVVGHEEPSHGPVGEHAQPQSKSQTISPAAAINADKRRRLVRTAKSLHQLPRFATRPIRIDVVTVEYAHADDRAPAIRHYVNAVTGAGKLR